MWCVLSGGCVPYVNWWMWSISIGECGLYQMVGPYQLVGVVNITWWVWSISLGGCGQYHLVGVVYINWGCGPY